MPDAARTLIDRSVLKAVDQTYGNETYLPRAIAFHYCGDPDALMLARKSMETVLRVVRDFYEQDLDKEVQDQRQTSSDVQEEAHKFDSDFELRMACIGLYLSEELGVFHTMQLDEKQVFVKLFKPSEHIYEVTKVSNPWDLHIERGMVSVERTWENQQSKTSPVGVPSGKDIFDVRSSFMDSLQIDAEQENQSKGFPGAWPCRRTKKDRRDLPAVTGIGGSNSS